jgi:hypothetical protein
MSDIFFGLFILIIGILVLVWVYKSEKAHGAFEYLNYTIPMTGLFCIIGGIYVIVRAIIEMSK